MLMRMLTGLSGPTLSLAPRDEHDFDDAEAERLQLAGYAEPVLDVPAPVAGAPAPLPETGPAYDASVSLPGAGDLVHGWARIDLPAAPVSTEAEIAPAAAPVRRQRKAKA